MPSTSPLDETEISEAPLITKEFSTRESFSTYIEQEAKDRNILVLEMLMEYCTESDVDPIAAASLITKALKEKIEVEANGLNLLKPKKVK
jgi:hypothetical protein